MYLVTGGAGFIGSSIARKLKEEGAKVRLLDDFSTGRRENLSGLENLELVEGSLLDDDCLEAALKGIEFVLHQAAIPSVPRSVADPVGSNEANVTGTLKLLEAARTAKVKRFVFAASSSAYGDTETLPKVESMAASPLSPYAVAKYAGELYVSVYARVYGLSALSLRYFNIFGPRQDPLSDYAAVIPKFILSMLGGIAPVIYGDGEQSRDFTYVDNAVSANLAACKSEKVGKGEAINVACGQRFTLNELVKELNGIFNTSYEPLYEAPRPGDVKHSMADISKAKELLGYLPAVGFKEGLEKTAAWFRQSGGGTK